MQADNKHEVVMSNDAALAVQRRGFLNRHPVVEGAVWFGAATATAWFVPLRGYWWSFSISSETTCAVLIFVVSSALVGGLFGRWIGNSGRSWFQLAKAVTLAAVVAFFGLYVAMVIVSLIWPGQVEHSLASLILRCFTDSIYATYCGGWYLYPLTMLAGAHLYWLRSKLPPSPKVLGCGRSEHAVQIAAKDGAP